MEKIFLSLGVFFLILGLLLKFNPLKLGSLPGDFVIARKNSTLFLPITSFLVLLIIVLVIKFAIKVFFN